MQRPKDRERKPGRERERRERPCTCHRTVNGCPPDGRRDVVARDGGDAVLCEELGRGAARLCEREREAAALREGETDPLAARAECRGSDVGEAVDGHQLSYGRRNAQQDQGSVDRQRIGSSRRLCRRRPRITRNFLPTAGSAPTSISDWEPLRRSQGDVCRDRGSSIP